MITSTIVAALTVIAAAQEALQSRAGILPSDSEIRRILTERVNALGGSSANVNIVVGVIGPQHRKLFYGRPHQQDRRPLDGDAVFEIASITKVFTAILLAEMVQRGEVTLTDPVAKYLPASIQLPERNGRSITLLDLATHTASLPFMPPLNDSAPANSTGQLIRFLSGYELTRDIGTKWDYSNIGYWLLGEALAWRAGTDYETLLRTRVIVPLKLKNTAITVSPKIKARLVPGLTAVLQPAPAFSAVPVYRDMPAAGGLVSTADDLLKLLSVAMEYERSPLTPAMAALLTTRRPLRRGESQALGWVVLDDKDGELIFHEGGAYGYASAIAWDPKNRVGVVALSNQVTSVSDVARHLLRSNFPLAKPTAVKRTEIALEPKVLDNYAGRYEIQTGEVVTIAREVDFLTLQLPAGWGLPILRLRPERPKEFFVAEFPFRVTIQTASDGQVSGILIDPGRGKQAVPARKANRE